MRREKPPGRQKGAWLFSMLLAVCLMIAALPLSVSAAGEYVPGNPRWSGYQNQVQWDRPAGAASGDSFEYEAQLLLGDDVVESKAVEIDTYLFFTNDVVTRPQEEYWFDFHLAVKWQEYWFQVLLACFQLVFQESLVWYYNNPM